MKYLQFVEKGVDRDHLSGKEDDHLKYGVYPVRIDHLIEETLLGIARPMAKDGNEVVVDHPQIDNEKHHSGVDLQIWLHIGHAPRPVSIVLYCLLKFGILEGDLREISDYPQIVITFEIRYYPKVIGMMTLGLHLGCKIV